MENSSRKGYKQYIVPLLKIVYEQQHISFYEAVNKVASYLEINDIELQEKTACGRQLKFSNQLISARTYLVRQGMVEYALHTQDKQLAITEKGNQFYRENLLFLSKPS